jgi:hypothetical protein
MATKTGNAIGGEAFAASGLPALAIEDAGDNRVRMMRG